MTGINGRSTAKVDKGIISREREVLDKSVGCKSLSLAEILIAVLNLLSKHPQLKVDWEHTHTQTNYNNPRMHAPSVNNNNRVKINTVPLFY